MRKIAIKSLIITSIINVVGCLTNLLCALLGDFLLIHVSLSGGEYQGYVGFGILLEHFIPLTTVDDPVSSSTKVSFSILNFVTYFIFIFIVVFAFVYYLNRRKENKKKKETKKGSKERKEDDDSKDYFES